MTDDARLIADDSGPFLLLDDARAEKAVPARLYRDPVAVVRADRASEVAGALDRLGEASRQKLHVAGYISYEAGLVMEPRLAGRLPDERSAPLLWFGLFEDYQAIPRDAVPDWLPPARSGWVGVPEPLENFTAYRAAFDRVQAHIHSGDIYQANLTFPTRLAAAGNPLAIYAALRERARAGYGGVIFDGRNWLLSCSPELFFTIRDGRIVARPMKGTAPRSADAAEDGAIARQLASDPKQRAENLMIVDLLRNDLSRVAVAGSVQVPDRFTVESFPTVHQMTSTVCATLAPGRDAVDVIRAIFPCGSITGAPKIRAMEVISELEQRERGIYCGSMGRIDPDGDAAFNVAIRTLWSGSGDKALCLGLGSGIVADSDVRAEWRECLAKGEFAHLQDERSRQIGLIETMRFEPDEGIIRLEAHLARMKASATALGFVFDRHAARNAIHGATFHWERPAKVRLLLAGNGDIAIELAPLPPAAESPLPCRVVPMQTVPDDFRLHHKTTDREIYAVPGLPSGLVPLYADADGRLTESNIYSLFVERDGGLLTPPLERGVLPGILRAELIEQGRAQEADLTAADLADGFLLGNAVRGLLSAHLA